MLNKVNTLVLNQKPSNKKRSSITANLEEEEDDSTRTLKRKFESAKRTILSLQERLDKQKRTKMASSQIVTQAMEKPNGPK